MPVAIDHEGRTAGLAELRLGAARGATEALYLALGTGIGAAPISRGEVLAGADGLAGELGHLPAMPGGKPCPCGQAGCTERYASAAALGRRYLSRRPGGTCRCRAGDRPGRRPATRSRAGCASKAIEALARALVCYTVLLDPALIVVGGGLSLAGAAAARSAGAKLAEGLPWRPAPALVPARFGADSGRIGAALLGWRARQPVASLKRMTGADPTALLAPIAANLAGALIALDFDGTLAPLMSQPHGLPSGVSGVVATLHRLAQGRRPSRHRHRPGGRNGAGAGRPARHRRPDRQRPARRRDLARRPS